MLDTAITGLLSSCSVFTRKKKHLKNRKLKRHISPFLNNGDNIFQIYGTFYFGHLLVFAAGVEY